MRVALNIALLCLFFVAQGCVSAGKHKRLQGEADSLRSGLAELTEKSNALDLKVQEQSRYITELENRLGRGASDKAKLEASLTETRQALEELSKRKLEADKRIAEFTSLTQRFRRLVDAGRLSVKMVDGRMVVALASDVLFPSGSARLSQEGISSIKEVAQLLVTIPDRKFQVEGHTDNIPIQTTQFPSNWELASARAQTVVNSMLQAGMEPNRISAASFGEHKPAQPNDSKEGRAANRRIEIVIVPDLSSLPGYEELQKMSQGR